MTKVILHLTASFVGAVGYGNVYKCTIIKNIEGDMKQGIITIIIMADDIVTDTVMQSHMNKGAFEIGFVLKAVNEPYPIMPINGFVDDQRTSWEIGYIKDISG